MTVEEIKQSTTMSAVIGQYGITIRNNMCSCPFHNDKSPSMKVFKDGCKCFTCNKSWDIFSFIQEMDGCDFKTAYKSLGGTYNKAAGDGDLLKKARLERQRKMKEQERRDREDHRREFFTAMNICLFLVEHYEYPSEEWCDGKRELEMLDRHLFDFERGGDISQDVFRRCVKLRQKYIDIK